MNTFFKKVRDELTEQYLNGFTVENCKLFSQLKQKLSIIEPMTEELDQEIAELEKRIVEATLQEGTKAEVLGLKRVYEQLTRIEIIATEDLCQN